MDRSEFLRMSLGAGVCCGAAALLGRPRGTLAAAEAAPPVTTCDARVKQGQKVLRRMMRQLDATFPEDVRYGFMASCGKACYDGAHGPRAAPPTRDEAREFLEKMTSYVGAGNVRHEGGETVVRFEYTENPRGLKTRDHYCLCPIMEDVPEDVSPTYCQCSVGYVREIFERGTGVAARVALVDSVLRGGKTCAFEARFRLAS